jgi:hypothetical protein
MAIEGFEVRGEFHEEIFAWNGEKVEWEVKTTRGLIVF